MSKHGRHTTGMATDEHGKQAQQRAERQQNAEGQHKATQQRDAERQGNARQQQKASTAERENLHQKGTVGAASSKQMGANQTREQTTGAAQAQARLSDQQRTRIRQSVLSERNVPRVQANDIHFAVNRGVAVPSRVSVVSVTRYPALVNAFPYYRDDSFFVTEDEIIFVGPDRRVVNVVPVGPRAPFARSGGYGYTAVNLPPDQIREVQEVLIDRGFLTGEADGVFGPRTREALIVFQRRQGIQANGSISTRTVAALGLSDKIDRDEMRGQSSTVGEGRGGAKEPNRMGREDRGRMNNRPTDNRATTGEAGGPRGAREPSDQHHSRAGHNTTGEAGPHNKSTKGEGGNNESMRQPGGKAMQPGQGSSTTGEGHAQAPDQGNMQSPGQGSGSPGQGSSPTHHNR
jgi:Putative peptidoglycan binding domain